MLESEGKRVYEALYCRIEETYLVSFQTAKGKKYELRLPENEWAALDDKEYTLQITLDGEIKQVVPRP